MNPMSLLPLALTADGTTTTAEAVQFWIIAPLVVLGALGLIFAKKTVYAAISIVFVMTGLAFLFIAQEAMFLGVVQIIVYTGAIMMLFLFVIMLIGVDASESLAETIRGQRALAWLFGVGVLVGVVGLVLSAGSIAPAGLEAANADSNPVGVARILFADHAFAMQLTGALLIVAAISAITLTKMERLRPPVTQPEVADAKMRAWAERGARIRQLPAPGVYASTNAADVPALAADGTAVVDSVPRVLRVRGQQRSIAEVAPHVLLDRRDATPQSRLPGMPGAHAPELEQPAGVAQITEGEDAS